MADAPPKPDRSLLGQDGSSGEADLISAFALVAETTREFANSRDLESTLARALNLIVDQLDAEAGSLWLLDDAGTVLTCSASAGPNRITGMELPVSRGIIGRSVRENICQSILDVQADPNFTGLVDQESGFVTHSLLCAPMSISDTALGAIEVVNKKGDDPRFGEADIHPLRVLASSAALALSNARMAESLVESERVQQELQLAAEIQQTLLPKPRPAPFPVAGVNIPARTVSGDFYDFLVLADGRIAFCLGDVSGKGMNAAILMTKTASLYRCLSKEALRPGALLARLNDELAETATRGMFVTMVAGVLDPDTGTVCLANAGHEPPLWHAQSGRFVSLPADAPPLGILPGHVFPENDLDLEGGSLYLFSDGLTEACTASGDQLGSKGFQLLVSRFVDKPVAERVAAVIAEVGKLELRDDLTLLALGLVGEAGSALGERLLELEVPARSDQLRRLRDAMRKCLQGCGCGEECSADIVMAVDEACQNIIRHGYHGDPDGSIRLSVDRRGDDVVVSLEDDAPTVDSSQVKPRDLDDVRPGGLGTHLIAELMDDARFVTVPSEHGNLLRMTKRIR